jgi:hypothetical protein
MNFAEIVLKQQCQNGDEESSNEAFSLPLYTIILECDLDIQYSERKNENGYSSYLFFGAAKSDQM